MTKHFARPQFAPRPTKGQLHKAAQEQHKIDETKVTVQATTKTEEPVALEIPSTQVEIVNDAAAAPAAKPETPPVETAPAAASPTPKPPKGTNDGLYALGKRYSPKTDRNSETWGKICKALAEGPKTMKELTEVVKGHGDFLGYMTRGGHIIPHVPTPQPVQEQPQVSG